MIRTFETLAIAARGDREIVITREFDAPRALVWEAMTKPEILKKWFGVFDGWTLDVCDVDLRPGGAFRYTWRKVTKEGKPTEMTMSGVFKEIVAPERIVHTEKFDDPWYEGEALDTLTLTESGGRTTMSYAMLLDSTEARDSVLKSNMEHGLAPSYDTLDQLLAGRN